MKKWIISKIDKSLAMSIADECEIAPFTALLLTARGINEPLLAEEFLSDESEFEDPYSFIDMEKAVDRIRVAITAGEKIAIYGDYDADGITATALIYSCIKNMNADVKCFLPHREGEGYGMNINVVDKIKSQNISLIITVDNGISSFDEINYACSLGIDVVVTDHHIQPEGDLPNAFAVIDPKRRDCPSVFKDYAGVAVAFMLASALENISPGELIYEYADLITIGTIADVMPLKGDNRRFVIKGLNLINNHKRLGIAALTSACGIGEKRVGAGQVAFMIAPRINAAGRIGYPEDALKLLLSDDEVESKDIAEKLCEINSERQKMESDIVKEAQKMLKEDENLLKQRVLVVAGKNWPKGIIGIAAARLSEKYEKPTVVFSVNGDEASGSARSYKGVSIYKLISASDSATINFGGHETAAGVSVESGRINEFRGLINQKAKEIYPVMPFPELNLDCKLSMKGISINTVYAHRSLEPFGAGNPAPIYCLLGMRLKNITSISEGKHLRLVFSKDLCDITVMKFNTTKEQFGYTLGDICDLAVTIDINKYNSQELLSIVIKDIRSSEIEQDIILKEIREYEAYLRGECELSIVAPERSRVADIYKKIRSMNGFFGHEDLLVMRIGGNYIEIMTILSALDELSLIKVDKNGSCITIDICKVEGKVDLASSNILNSLKKSEV